MTKICGKKFFSSFNQIQQMEASKIKEMEITDGK
jgi:hypothetical protein